ncbi:MAG TPA: ChbG/HpnK family deacetylase [Vicinamibacterales bacterium]|nr:ChbG/HpnK family deacetylase [Vicinamibacterales bacterium]
MRQLVVNGDDFGLTPGINAGMIDAHRDGVLTSVSLMAGAPAVDEALTLARATPTLGVGCHLTLVDGAPVLPVSQLPTLTVDGRFHPTWGSFMAAGLSGRLALPEVERELAAQIDRVRSGGVTPTHLDSHKHVHLWPPVFDIVARLAARFGIAVVRVPYERPAAGLALRHLAQPGARRQAMENVLMAPWARRAGRLLARHGLPPAPRFTGRAITGLWSVPALAPLLRRLPEGRSELMAHPGYPDAALDAMRTRLRAARADEIAVLRAPAVREMLRAEGIVLVPHGATAAV